ncbi:MAG: hypothetical protein K0B11_12110 [Mariniphaga sp.]|nr:hypothetical protein [Mariniphaga sp.]
MKEKDYIEELILKNLKELNNDEPPAGHFERFEAKLEGTNQKKKIISLNLVWKVAAAAVFAFLVVNQGIVWFSPEKGNESVEQMATGMTLASLSPEYEEVEFYFTSAINGGLSQWERLISEGLISEDEQQMMDNELNEFEVVYKNLQADLSANPNDERVINAMLEYYQTKLSLINMIVEKLEEVKQKTNVNYETES